MKYFFDCVEYVVGHKLPVEVEFTVNHTFVYRLSDVEVVDSGRGITVLVVAIGELHVRALHSLELVLLGIPIGRR